MKYKSAANQRLAPTRRSARRRSRAHAESVMRSQKALNLSTLFLHLLHTPLLCTVATFPFACLGIHGWMPNVRRTVRQTHEAHIISLERRAANSIVWSAAKTRAISLANANSIRSELIANKLLAPRWTYQNRLWWWILKLQRLRRL